MEFFSDLTHSIAILVILILTGTLLKTARVLKEEQSALFARVVTSVTLPAVIFGALSTHRLHGDQVLMSGLFMGAELACFIVAWACAKMLHLDAPKRGAFILVSVFGSSAFLGYPIVRGAFPGQGQAMSDAVMISELGVGTLIFTLGIIIAMYYGSGGLRPGEMGEVLLKFLRSPVFIAIAAGILFSVFPLPQDNKVVSVLYGAVRVVGKANTLIVALTIGLMLRVPRLKNILLLAVCACIIKLILQPIFAAVPTPFFTLPELGKRILILEAAMPSAALTAVFCKRYGCDGQLASILVMCTIFVSVLTVIGMVGILG